MIELCSNSDIILIMEGHCAILFAFFPMNLDLPPIAIDRIPYSEAFRFSVP